MYSCPNTEGKSDYTGCEEADRAASGGFRSEWILGIRCIVDRDGKYGKEEK